MAKKSYKSSAIRGKKRVCAMLSSNARLKRYVPRTMLLSAANLSTMLASYRSVYIKPDVGSLGIGVCKATAVRGGYRLAEIKGRKQYTSHFASIGSLYRHLKRVGKGTMIVQKSIALAEVAGRPYDIRMMVQRKPRGKWTFTGSFARIARKGKIVTNYSQGGRLWTIRRLHRAEGLTAAASDRKYGRLKRISVRTANWLGSKRAGMHEIGIDFAYDRSGRTWILEVNSNHPQFHPLAISDPPTYRRMMTFARSYGRRSAK
ncbi:YheC/YheD family protein [Paenibacillus sacheonensis]|uniref:YheC/YheD family protein n=1 Tax=Paenibacillus sacheonensis TaxID=742054 RepID=A0A7X5BZG7_9BACL|nr:YheC/YheD family protein [Paenibacillus sacheonensis]MBM7563252.1 glutathione synthase/RimK-type ligase-like ATP-grasp enzyme [Paenibacillus sacheonensis]NBC68190.1 hypothetical protein [Paenibacillus sacheonensis]